MTAPAAIPLDDEDAARKARAARRMEVLAELVDTGMEITRRIRAEVRALNGVETVEDLKIAPTSGELSLAFFRVSRAVRQTLALERKFDEPPAAARQTPEEAEAERRRQAEIGARVRRRLTHVFMKAGPGFESFVDGYEKPLPGEFDDEPECDDWREDGAYADDAEVVEEICADLGVERDVSVFREGGSVGKAVSSAMNSDSGVLAAGPLHHPPPAATAEGALQAPVRRGGRQIVGDPMGLASQGPASHPPPPPGEELEPRPPP